MPKLLEIIATSAEDAIEAEKGGADRIELCKDLEQGGMTPDIKVVEETVRAVKIPVRVMLRSEPGFVVRQKDGLDAVCAAASAVNQLGVDGIVIGFLDGRRIDLESLRMVLASAPNVRCTFHRAFEELSDVESSLALLKSIPQIDRILTNGSQNGSIGWEWQKRHLQKLAVAAEPEMKILAGGAISPEQAAELSASSLVSEFHFGRAARSEFSNDSPVSARKVAELRKLLFNEQALR